MRKLELAFFDHVDNLKTFFNCYDKGIMINSKNKVIYIYIYVYMCVHF